MTSTSTTTARWFMTSDDAQAAAVREKAFASGAPYVLWKQQQWNSDGSVQWDGEPGRPDPEPLRSRPHRPHPRTCRTGASRDRRRSISAPHPAGGRKNTPRTISPSPTVKPWEREDPKARSRRTPTSKRSGDGEDVHRQASPSSKAVTTQSQEHRLEKVAHNRAMAWPGVK